MTVIDTTTTPEPTQERLPRNVRALALVSLLTDISSEMVLTLLPIFLTNVLGVRTNVIGLIEGVAESTSSLLKLVSGRLSDRLGNRKKLTVAGYGLSTLAKPFFLLATSWFGVLVVRFADRVGKGIRSAPRDALIADSVSTEQRGAAFGLHRAADTLGAFIGLGIALFIVLLMGAGSLTLTRYIFQWLVVISTIPAVLAVLVLILGVREAVRTPRPMPTGATVPALRPNRHFALFLGIVALFTLGNSADAFLMLRAQERGLSIPGVLLMLMTFNAVYALVSLPAGRWSDRVGRRQVLQAGWLVYVLLYLGFAFAVEIWQVWALYALYGIYHGIADGAARAFVADLVAPEQRGAAYGAYNMVVGLMALPGNLLTGVLWQGVGEWAGFGASAPFVAGAVLAALALIAFRIWDQKRLEVQ
jgi:MFS family permease